MDTPSTIRRTHPRDRSHGAPADVIVGISGGVDSAVAAALLVEQGHRVRGLFMKNWDEDDDTEYCTAVQDLADARTVCDRLGIELLTANFAAEYWDDVFERFLEEYRNNRTPNPDVLCNREIKFKQFRDYASALGADTVATGHYARRISGHRTGLAKGVDSAKDQTYFLQAVPGEAFANCLFPLGELQKCDVRARARTLNLPVHDKKDSTGICFIGERRFRDFLSRYVPPAPGPIVTAAGKTVGTHRGLAYYTLGQRRGLGIGGIAGAHPEHAPWYVCDKRRQTNSLVVTQDEADLANGACLVDQVNWLEPVTLPLVCTVRVRHQQADQNCVVQTHASDRLRIVFEQPQRAIAPGQYAAFYSGELCLGGSRIVAREPYH